LLEITAIFLDCEEHESVSFATRATYGSPLLIYKQSFTWSVVPTKQKKEREKRENKRGRYGYALRRTIDTTEILKS
jgi:hypothetical protein